MSLSPKQPLADSIKEKPKTDARHTPSNIENITGLFDGTVSKRGNFVARELQYIADEQWFSITAIAERSGRHSERQIELVLHRNIQSGKYHFEDTPADPVVWVHYYERSKIGFEHHLLKCTTLKGKLDWKILEDNTHFSLKLHLSVETHKGNTLEINVKGDFWLAIALV